MLWIAGSPPDWVANMVAKQDDPARRSLFSMVSCILGIPLEGGCSIQLSYGRFPLKSLEKATKTARFSTFRGCRPLRRTHPESDSRRAQVATGGKLFLADSLHPAGTLNTVPVRVELPRGLPRTRTAGMAPRSLGGYVNWWRRFFPVTGDRGRGVFRATRLVA